MNVSLPPDRREEPSPGVRTVREVAHDLNNRLSIILNYATFVAEATEGDEAVSADVEQIRTAAESAVALTRQLLRSHPPELRDHPPATGGS